MATTTNADPDSRGGPTTGATVTPQIPAPTATAEFSSNLETAAKVAFKFAIALDLVKPRHGKPPKEPYPSQQAFQSHIHAYYQVLP